MVQLEREIALAEFPSPQQLWAKFCAWKGYTAAQLPVITQAYHDDGSGKSPRYYQLQAINKTLEAISAGQQRVLLVMATGTGKTYTAFQIIFGALSKTIVFCNDIDHAERMRRALVNLNPEQVAKNGKYMMKITGDLVATPTTLAETMAAQNIADDTISEGSAGTFAGTDETPAAYGASAIVNVWSDSDDKVRKFQVCGVTVKKLAERVQYYDSDGKLVTESFKDYTRHTLKKQFASLDDFVKRWQDAERKQAVLTELADAGVIWDALAEDVGRDLDPFDLICHVVFDQPALTRRERAEQVKKRNYFVKYSAAAQVVLNALLDKYADVGVVEMENIQVFKAPPFTQMGAPMEIVKGAFGSKRDYEQALTELEALLYA